MHRIAGSGTGIDAICDVICIKDGIAFYVECKKRKDVYYMKSNEEQLKRLISAANLCGSKPVLAVRFNHCSWMEFNLNEVPIGIIRPNK